MARKFEHFVILADMRTGSNALEEKLGAYEGIVSFGEVFNPHFIGKADCTELFEKSLKQRDDDPVGMIGLMRRATKDLAGFRLFSDHDPRVLDHCLSNRKCAKIVLTRNMAESYVSLKIARSTGQWWIGDMKGARSGKADFIPEEFDAYCAERTAYLSKIRRRLQETGQTAFYIDCSEINDDAVIAGLARYLGSRTQREDVTVRGKVQHPKPMSEKVTNYLDMKSALSARDPFKLDAIPDFEPARGPNVPSYLICQKAPLLFMPIKCTAEDVVQQWMLALDGSADGELISGQTQKQLRNWKRQQGRHLTFTVVSHPVERAHRAFCRFILPNDPPAFVGIRDVLTRNYDIALPKGGPDEGWDATLHANAFLGFLRFLRGNLAGQTSVRIDSVWASQGTTIRGMAEFALPDAILREDELAVELGHLAKRLGRKTPEQPTADSAEAKRLAEIYSDKIEAAARAAYQRDYMTFGFGAWNAGRA